MDNIKFIRMLYTQLRTQEGLYYLPYRYKWILGIEVFNELKDKSYNKNLYDPEATLFEEVCQGKLNKTAGYGWSYL